jgi:hypothetical protein
MVTQSVAEIIRKQVVLEVEGIDRLYLNGYVPMLQTEGGFVHFVRNRLGLPIASTVAVAGMTTAFVKSIEQFAESEGVDVVTFRKGQRKDDVAKEYLARCSFREGVLFIGKAQEKARVFRTIRKQNPQTGKSYPWITRGSALPNHYYFYLLDADFGPLFIKFCSYFPYAVKVCLNGHEWVKQQLTKEGIPFTALDNGVLSCDDPVRLQQLCDSLDAGQIEAVFRKWLARLPHPFRADDEAAGYRYELSILQAEFSLTRTATGTNAAGTTAPVQSYHPLHICRIADLNVLSDQIWPWNYATPTFNLAERPCYHSRLFPSQREIAIDRKRTAKHFNGARIEPWLCAIPVESDQHDQHQYRNAD